MFTKFREKYSWLDWPSWILWPLIFLLFLMICWHRVDPDFGWHLMTGRDILAHGIPQHDIFTYTALDFQWINVEWLNDVLFAKLYDAGGYALLGVFCATIWTSSIAIISRIHPPFSGKKIAKNAEKSRRIASPLLLAAAVLFAAYAGSRTQIWMVSNLAVLYFILNSPKKIFRWVLPALFIVWAQLHGSWPAGIALIGWWALFREKNLREKLNLILIAALSFAVTLINPYGWNAYFVIIQTAFDHSLKSTISEWMPLWVNIPKETAAFMVVALLAALLFFVKKSHRNINVLRDPLWPFLIASFFSTRYLPLFAMFSLGAIDEIFRENISEIPRKISVLKKCILAGCSFVFAMILSFSFYSSGFMISQPVNPEKAPLLKITDYFARNPCQGNIFNSYNFGGYFIWKMPEKKVFIDGRMPSWTTNGALFGSTYMEEYNRVINDDAFREKTFAKYNITCVAIDKFARPDKPIAEKLRENPEWKTVFEEPGMIVFRKK